MYLILHYYKSIVDGVMTSLIDLYNNLTLIKGPENVFFKIICPELYLLDNDESKNIYYPKVDLQNIEYFKYKKNSFDVKKRPVKYPETLKELQKNEVTCKIPFLQLNKNFGDVHLSRCLEYLPCKFEEDTIICSGRLLFEILCGEDIEIKCNRMFVLDSMDILKSKLGIFPNLDNAVPTDNCTFLINPSTLRQSKYEQVIHFAKFSKTRMDWIYCTRNGVKDVLDYKREGKKKIEIYPGKYAENMGKHIFEHLYKGKTVNYYPDGMFMEDGLFYYLALFGIDGWKEHTPLEISPEEIERKLFLNSKDFLFRI